MRKKYHFLEVEFIYLDVNLMCKFGIPNILGGKNVSVVPILICEQLKE